MIYDANLEIPPGALTAHYCIMGAGVAGITLAKKLAQSGKKIILIDSGAESYDPKTQNLYESDSVPPRFPDTTVSRLRFLGGSSNHWENSTERLDRIDFEKRDWVTDSGWPITYNELSSYYPEAESLCGLDKRGFDIRTWESLLDFRAPLVAPKSIHTSVLKHAHPTTRFFEKYGKALQQSGNVTILTNANVTDLSYTDGKVTAAQVQTLASQQHRITAEVFVMCFGGIENARLLLHFNKKHGDKLGNTSDKVGRYFMEHPTVRAANLYPLNGALNNVFDGIFTMGQLIRTRFKLSDEALRENRTNNLRLILRKSSKLELSTGLPSSHMVLNNIKNSQLPDNFGYHLSQIVSDIDLIGETFLRKKFNYKLLDSADEFGGYQVISMIEQTPQHDNRILLGEKTDALGIQKPRIEWSVSDEDIETTWKSLMIFAKDPAINKIGRVRVNTEMYSQVWGSQMGFGQHHIGSTKMGSNETEGVVDPSLKVFGTDNLYITGSSVFPTGGHVPPTLTIVAITLMLADTLMKEKA